MELSRYVFQRLSQSIGLTKLQLVFLNGKNISSRQTSFSSKLLLNLHLRGPLIIPYHNIVALVIAFSELHDVSTVELWHVS